jgi:DNA topoisomerase-3
MQDIEVPDFHKGQTVKVDSVKISEHQTRPPPYLSESDLLGLMEKNGIGTDASMATHIKNICDRNYVELGEGRRLKPTKLGITLVHGYQVIDNELVIPKVRATIESQCSLIAQGKAKKEEVVDHTLKLFCAKFDYFVAQIETMDNMFESNFTHLAESGKSLTRCGGCKKYLSFISKKPKRLYCRNCSQTYKLPFDADKVTSYHELRCPLDQFELVQVLDRSGRKYPLCPYCYNDPPWDDESWLQWYLVRHKDLGVCGCPDDSCDGWLCLDPNSAPKWRLQCSGTCQTEVHLWETGIVHKISVSKEECENEECGSRKLAVTFNLKRSPLAGGATEKTACIVCDATFNKGASSTLSRGRPRTKGKGKGKKGKGKGKDKNVDPRLTFDGF